MYLYLHHTRYLVEASLNLPSKLFWLVVCLLCGSLALLLASESYAEWQADVNEAHDYVEQVDGGDDSVNVSSYAAYTEYNKVIIIIICLSLNVCILLLVVY